jgi:two-component system response regulator FlrC
LLESELFGFEKGAFTGAQEKKIGKFELADGGTLLLDEIGELDPLLQAKLLRVLQEGEVDRLGGRKPIKVDVRILATTNRNLAELVRKGLFREDLYFRLYGVRFEVPALAQRRGDIMLLAERFAQRESERLQRELSFDEGVLERISQRDWPGNIRELERAIERAAILSDTGIIKFEDFDFEHVDPSTSVRSEAELQFVTFSNSKPIREMEKEIILSALEAHQGNRTHTAKALGMSLRTLRHKLKQYRESGDWVEEARQARLGKIDPMGLDKHALRGESVASKPG